MNLSSINPKEDLFDITSNQTPLQDINPNILHHLKLPKYINRQLNCCSNASFFKIIKSCKNIALVKPFMDLWKWFITDEVPIRKQKEIDIVPSGSTLQKAIAAAIVIIYLLWTFFMVLFFKD